MSNSNPMNNRQHCETLGEYNLRMMSKMTVMDMLHAIEKERCIYNIHYCKIGVGFVFYDPEEDKGDYRAALSIERYYPTFEEAVKVECERLFK